MTTVADLLLDRADDDRPALLFGDQAWSYRQLVEEGRRRAATVRRAPRPRPPAAHRGAARQRPRLPVLARGRRAVGRGGRRHQLDLPGRAARPADRAHRLRGAGDVDGLAPLLDGAADVVPPDRVLRRGRARPTPTGSRRRAPATRRRPTGRRGRPLPADLHVGLDRPAQGGALHTGPLRPHRRPRGRPSPRSTADDVVYSPLPFFHSSSLFTGWSSALTAGVPIATRPRFSASNTLGDRPTSGRLAHVHGQGVELHPRRARSNRATPTPRCASRSATRRPSATSRSSHAASTAWCATATARPRASS